MFSNVSYIAGRLLVTRWASVPALPLADSHTSTGMLKVGGLRDDIGQSWTWEQLCIMGFATGALDAVSFPGE